MKALVMSLVLIATSFAQPRIVFNKQGNVWQEDTESGVGQVYDLIDQLARHMGNLPPEVERLAFHQIKVDKREISPGMARYIQGLIEETFKKEGRKAVVSAPDLKTTRIIVTDSTLQMSNALPDVEALWTLGRKLRVDAFLQGTLTLSKDKDLLLQLNLIRQETAEVIWSCNIVAGPNKKKSRPFGLEYTLTGGFGYWMAEKYTTRDTSVTGGLSMYRYVVDFGVTQGIGSSKRVQMHLYSGFGMMSPVADDPESETFENSSTQFELHVGADLIFVIMPKVNPDFGYWMGMYLGGQAQFPNSLIRVRGGYSSRLSPNLGFGLGVSYLPLNRSIKTGLLGITNETIIMEPLTYEAQIHYFF